MTDPEFAVAINFTGLSKAQLLTMANHLADKVEGYPASLQKAVASKILTQRQANVLDAVRAVRGDAWAEGAALALNHSQAVVDLADQVKDWVALNKGATEAEIRKQFPAIKEEWSDIKRYLVNAKLVQQAFR